jgi:SnoaL-like domain
MTRTTDEVIDRFNRAFEERDATLLEDIIAPDCVMESVQPAPDGTRYEGYDASFSSWKALIDDTTSHFEVEDVHAGDEWGAHPLALRLGPRLRRLGPWRQRHAGRRWQDRRGRRLLEDPRRWSPPWRADSVI